MRIILILYACISALSRGFSNFFFLKEKVGESEHQAKHKNHGYRNIRDFLLRIEIHLYLCEKTAHFWVARAYFDFLPLLLRSAVVNIFKACTFAKRSFTYFSNTRMYRDAFELAAVCKASGAQITEQTRAGARSQARMVPLLHERCDSVAT